MIEVFIEVGEDGSGVGRIVGPGEELRGFVEGRIQDPESYSNIYVDGGPRDVKDLTEFTEDIRKFEKEVYADLLKDYPNFRIKPNQALWGRDVEVLEALTFDDGLCWWARVRIPDGTQDIVDGWLMSGSVTIES